MIRLDGTLPIAKELYPNYLQDNVKVNWATLSTFNAWSMYNFKLLLVPVYARR